MIDPTERSLYPSEEHGDHAAQHALAELDRAYTTAPPPHLRVAMDRAVYARMAALHAANSPARSTSRFVWRIRPTGARLRLISLVAALLLSLSGVAGYLRLSSPTPVSAQTVLHRAAAAMRLAPNEGAHASYAIVVDGNGVAAKDTAASGLTGTADVWIQTGASGTPALSAQTLTMDKAGMTSRFIQVGQHVYAYNPEMRGDNTIMIDAARGYPSWLVPADVFDGAGVTQELNTLAARSPQRVTLLPRQVIDGHTVDVIEVDGWANRPAQRTIFYFDAQSYVLRGFDANSLAPWYPMPSWQARLRGYATMAATQVPSGTFTLNAPATAQVHLPDMGDPAVMRTFASAFAVACHGGSAVNPKAMLRSGQSLLAACRANAPDVTQAGLVAALAAPDRAMLDAAVAAGQITPAQAAAGLASLQAWLTTWITVPGGTGK